MRKFISDASLRNRGQCIFVKLRFQVGRYAASAVGVIVVISIVGISNAGIIGQLIAARCEPLGE
jgi:hypothetical protein